MSIFSRYDGGTGLEPLASGRDADVFVIDSRRVFRHYRRRTDVAAEVTIMAYVAQFGFPVPAVYEAEGADMVLERLNGPTLLEAIKTGYSARDAASVLASLHGRLHELPPRQATHPGTRILHLDLQPGNVILTPREPVLIDWGDATEGPPDLDLALSAVIIAHVAVDSAHDMTAYAGIMLTEFLRRAGGSPVSMLDAAVALRGSDSTLTEEEAKLLPAAATLIRSTAKIF